MELATAALGQFLSWCRRYNRQKKDHAPFIGECQDPQTGLMIGPELITFEPPTSVMHGREHLLFSSNLRRGANLPTLRHPFETSN